MDKILSIIVPSYNMEAYLPKCLESLIIDDQELLQKLDVIVVNDGSKDRTSEMAHEFEAKYPGVFRVIDKPNGHYGSCINAGLSAAAGKYIKILEPDDTYDTKNFIEFISYLHWCLSREIDVVLSELITVGKSGKVFSHARHTLEQGKIYPISELTNTRGCVFNGGLTYRTELLRSFGYSQMEGVCYSDTQWYLVPLCYAKTLACFPKVIYRYFVERDGQSMDRAQYARNTWMMEKVAIKLLESYDTNIKHAHANIAKHYRRLVYECLLSIYVACIIWKERELSKTDLRVLDRTIRTMAPDIFAKISDAKWSNSVLPYHYVKAWRNNSVFLPFMSWLCRHYSAVVMYLEHHRKH